MSALPPLKSLITQLLRINSISSFDTALDQSNKPVIDLLAGWLEHLGFHCELQALPSNPNKFNLIATLGQGDGGLVFAGHTDTVPFDESGWKFDALGCTEADDKLFGLGSCDMKGFFAVVIDLLQREFHTPPKHPIIIIATADEESSMEGAEALAATSAANGGDAKRTVIIGEPTGLKPIVKHKSITMQRITIDGQSGHSSNPELGNNAMEAMHDVMAQLLAYRNTLQQRYQDASFEVVTPTMNFGCIHGGDSANRICGKCQLDIDLRLLPGMQNQAVLHDVNQMLANTAKQRHIDIHMDSLFDGINPFEQAEDSRLVNTVKRLTGSEPSSVAFATEAPYFKAMGYETIVMGPGSIDQAHQPNEFLALDAIKPAQDLFKALIEQYCY